MTEMIKENKIYDRQKRETNKEWHCFVHYRDLGIARSTNRTAHLLRIDTTYIERVARKWNWLDRVYEWDLVVDRTKRTLILNNIEEMRDRHWEVSQRMFRFAADQIEKYLRAFSTSDHPMIKPGDLVKVIEAAAKLERSVYGEPDLTVKVKGERESAREMFKDQEALAVIDGLVERMQQDTESETRA